MAHTIEDLDRLINDKLDYYAAHGNDLSIVYKRLQTTQGRIRVFQRIKDMILKEGVTDVDVAVSMLNQMSE